MSEVNHDSEYPFNAPEDWPEELKRLQRFAENARLLRDEAESIAREALEKFNEAYKAFDASRSQGKVSP